MKLINDNNPNLTFVGNWIYGEDDRYNFTHDDITNSYYAGDEIRFNFTGTSLKVRTYLNHDTSGYEINIDDKIIEEIPTALGSISTGISYELTDLENKEHFCTIKVLSENVVGGYKTRLAFDGIYIDNEAEIKPFNKNLLTNKYLFQDNGLTKSFDLSAKKWLTIDSAQASYESIGIDSLDNLIQNTTKSFKSNKVSSNTFSKPVNLKSFKTISSIGVI